MKKVSRIFPDQPDQLQPLVRPAKARLLVYLLLDADAFRKPVLAEFFQRHFRRYASHFAKCGWMP